MKLLRPYHLLLGMTAATLGGCSQPQNAPAPTKDPVSSFAKDTIWRQYSKAVADSFSVYIHLPNDYKPGNADTYPVVYLLDANLYFDIMATMIRKYSEVGLAPSVILVGIGYKDFRSMDSLRNRDDTYPEAIPEYEMKESGGAKKFLTYLRQELGPSIDHIYKTDPHKRILMGHSLGGYFTLYALTRQLDEQNHFFNGFIAASPSLHYNNYYLLDQWKHMRRNGEEPGKEKAYVAFGGLENDETDPKALRLPDILKQLQHTLLTDSTVFQYKDAVFSGLDHMETQIPTFIKGLQWMLAN